MIIEVTVDVVVDINALIIRMVGGNDLVFPTVNRYLRKLLISEFSQAVKVQPFQFLLDEIIQRTVFAPVYDDTLNKAIQTEIRQIHIDLNGKLSVGDGGMTNADGSHIGEVCR